MVRCMLSRTAAKDIRESTSSGTMPAATRPLTQAAVREALIATARHRGVAVTPLSTAIGNLIALRAGTYTAYRSGLGRDAGRLPPDFEALVAAVTGFADGLVDVAQPSTRWDPAARRWDS